MGLTNRSCRCGADFETLTRLRKHQRDECELRETVVSSDLEVDETADLVAAELYECWNCGRSVDEAAVDVELDGEQGPQVSASFDCPCGARNENRAFLGA